MNTAAAVRGEAMRRDQAAIRGGFRLCVMFCGRAKPKNTPFCRACGGKLNGGTGHGA